MKQIPFFLVIFSWNLFGQTNWEWQEPHPQGNNLRSILIIDSSTVMAGGDFSTIVRSSDAGENWSVVYFENGPLHSVNYFAFAYSTCYALVDSNIILRSADQGNRWEIMPLDFELNCRAIASGGNTLWIAGKDNKLLRSIDSGIKWEEIVFDSIKRITSVFFLDDKLGWAAGVNQQAFVYKTTNGGDTWNLHFTQKEEIRKIKFIDEDEGWQINNYSDGLRRTTDGGKTWAVKKPEGYSFSDLLLIDTQKVFVSSSDKRIYGTTNHGENWTKVYPEGDAVYFYNTGDYVFSSFYKGRAYCAGSNGSLMKYDNNKWQGLNNPVKSMFTSVSFKQTVGLAASYSGDNYTFNGKYETFSVIYKTTNSGKHWSELKSFGTIEIRKVFIADESTFIAAGKSLYVSKDNGVTWQKKFDSEGYIYSLYFSSPDRGYAGGLGGKLFQTSDGGNTWYQKYINTNFAIVSIFFSDDQNGWLTAENGLIFSTKDAGENWTLMNSPTNTTLFSIQFVNDNTGYCAGDKIFRT